MAEEKIPTSEEQESEEQENVEATAEITADEAEETEGAETLQAETAVEETEEESTEKEVSTATVASAPASRGTQSRTREDDDYDGYDDDDDYDDYDDDDDYDDYEEAETRYVDGPADYVQRERRGRGRRIGSDIRVEEINYKNISLLTRFLDRRGRILSRRKTRVSAKVQRRVVREIKRARHLALLPYTADQTRIVRKRR